ncbi:MAG: gliding motility-associated C-terminal domain-containing protein [Bacteroidetes bacterium]|nr:gliding motility-associated C-terminal domain-containing protein [Bacteroidota bacterium]
MKKTKYIFQLSLLLFSHLLFTQNSMVGDGFGGRLWYQPTNYTVGSYSGYSICYTGPCSNGANQLYGWGSNFSEQLGYSSSIIPTGVTTPTPIPSMTNVKYYSTGYIMGAIKNDNSGWVWGSGIGATPTQVITNAKFLDASSTNISFVKYDGTVWSIGSNTSGNFGDGSYNSANTIPIQMQNITNAVRVANSYYSTTILLADGTLKSVGSNLIGTLGIGNASITETLSPSPIPLLSNIIDIKATTQNVIALDANGDVYTWGMGSGIGDGDNSDEYSPKKITTLSNIVAISGCDDGYHFMALDANKNCYMWGSINLISTSPVLTPSLVATNVIDIMAGEFFSYLVKADGSLWCSGASNGGSIWLNLSDEIRDTFTLVNPALVAGACSVSSALANTTPACNINDGSVIVSQSGGQAPYTYNIGSGNQSSNAFTGLTAGNYTVTITDNNACVTTVTCSVSTGSGSSPTITVNSPTICAGTNTIITANGALNYSWSNASTLNSASGYSVVANPTVTTIYTITGTSNNACAGFNTSTVTVIEKPMITSTTNSICLGSSVIFNASALGTHSWSPSNTLNTSTGTLVVATPTSNTTYTIQSTNGICSFTNTQTIIVDNAIPVADFNGITDLNLTTGTILQLNNLSTNATSFKWVSCDNAISTNSILTLPLTTIGDCCISLIAYNNICTDTTTKCVKVFSEFELLIPNVFTPNGDQANDVFKITSKGLKTLHCEIYNRWGMKLYEWDDINGFWDGKTKTGLAPDGTYFFIVNYTNNENETKTEKGFLSLFRN